MRGRSRPPVGRAEIAVSLDPERRIGERSDVFFRRSLGSPRLFAIIYTPIASAIYFSLGVVAGYALGLTPVVFLAAGLYFAITAMTYVEGASLHQDRGGATVFARYAFDELTSFVAGWAVLLDYTILIAVCALSATNYLQVFWHGLAEGATEVAISIAIIAWVAVRNVRGFSRAAGHGRAGDRRGRRRPAGPADRAGPGDVLRRRPADLADPPGQRADVERPGVRADHRDGRLHEPGVGLRAGRRGGRGALGPQAPGDQRQRDRHRRLRRHRAGGDRGAAGGRRPHRAVLAAVRGGAGPRPDRPDGPDLAGQRPQVRDRRGGDRDADRGGRGGDARPVAAGLPAGHQPPDPQRRRAPAPDALDALRGDRHRGGAGGRAGDPARPRLPRRHLRVRRDAGLPDRAPVGGAPAHHRARPQRGPTGCR